MWLQMRIWVTHGCLFITRLMPAVHWPQQRQLTPQLFGTQRAGADAFNVSLNAKTTGCRLRLLSPTWSVRPSSFTGTKAVLNGRLVVAWAYCDEAHVLNNLWLWSTVCLLRWWHFYFSRDELLKCGECSEPDRSVYARACVCVCIHVWWNLLEDSLTLRLTSTSHTSYFSLVYRFHVRCHTSIPYSTDSLQMRPKFPSPFWWLREVISYLLHLVFSCRVYFYASPLYIYRQHNSLYCSQAESESSQRRNKRLELPQLRLHCRSECAPDLFTQQFFVHVYSKYMQESLLSCWYFSL